MSNKAEDQVRIGIIGDYDASYTGHLATGHALESAAQRLGLGLTYEWVATDRIAAAGTSVLEPFDGLWCSPGSPYRSMEGALAGIRFARERDWPFFGT